MGSPAKRIRELNESDLTHIREAGRVYVHYASEFRNGLKLV
jgi:carbonic anhydrase/acetyltransferase-like protein (isoleucine patch superfamily)